MTDAPSNALLAGLLRQREALDELIALAKRHENVEPSATEVPAGWVSPKVAANLAGVTPKTARGWAKSWGTRIGGRLYLPQADLAPKGRRVRR